VQLGVEERISKGGIVIALMTVGVVGIPFFLSKEQGEALIFVGWPSMFGGAAAALFIRSIRGPLNLVRGIASWSGGFIFAFTLWGSFVLARHFDVTMADILGFTVIGFVFAVPLLWIGFRRPRPKADEPPTSSN